jgi:subtilisin-like proprotein convertase family protein
MMLPLVRRRRIATVAILFIALAACGDAGPRYGTVTLGLDAPRAELSGSTHGSTPALELAPGCAGLVDPDAPDHLVTVTDVMKLGVSATSDGGPVALVVSRREDESFFCDSDDNTGIAPHVQLVEPGTYEIRVAALGATDPLPYRLLVAPDSKEEHRGPSATRGDALVSVTVTSTPAGAEVRTASGQVLGVTPALLELPSSTIGPDGKLSLVVEARGGRPQAVGGVPMNGELVLHASLAPAGPRQLEVSSTEPQPIRDFRTAEQRVEVAEECVIRSVEIDVDIAHSYVGDLVVEARSPTGTTTRLSAHRGGASRNLHRTYDASNARGLRSLSGEQGSGTWTLMVRDDAEQDIGTLNAFTLRLTCEPPGTAAATTTTPTSTTAAATLQPNGLRVPTFFQPRARRRAPDVIDPWARP